jgi:hypothetical protein
VHRDHPVAAGDQVDLTSDEVGGVLFLVGQVHGLQDEVDVIGMLHELRLAGLLGQLGRQVVVDPDRRGDLVEDGPVTALHVDPEEFPIPDVRGRAGLEGDLLVAPVRVVETRPDQSLTTLTGGWSPRQRTTARRVTTTIARTAVP